MSFASDSLRVAWIDMRFIRRNLPVVLITSLVACFRKKITLQ